MAGETQREPRPERDVSHCRVIEDHGSYLDVEVLIDRQWVPHRLNTPEDGR